MIKHYFFYRSREIIFLKNYIKPNSSAADILCSPDSWKQLMPPLHIFLITCIEVFFEKYFIESCKKADGKSYGNYEEWREDINTFIDRYSWSNKKLKKSISQRFSFQNLKLVNELYKVSLKIDLEQIPNFPLIKLMFSKRHLYTHKGGLIDKKFLREYNDYHESSKHISENQLGKIATTDLNVMIDSIAEAKKFVNYIVQFS